MVIEIEQVSTKATSLLQPTSLLQCSTKKKKSGFELRLVKTNSVYMAMGFHELFNDIITESTY